jgi:MSHA pilin protein MshD
MIELIIFIVVVSAGLAGILSVMNTVVKSSADPMVRKQTVAVAESLLEEILLKDYTKPAGSTVVGYPGGPRKDYDCVSDYAGYKTTGGIVDKQNPPQAISGLTSYNISSVTVGSNIPSVLIKVTVSVTGPGGTISLSGYRGNY